MLPASANLNRKSGSVVVNVFIIKKFILVIDFIFSNINKNQKA